MNRLSTLAVSTAAAGFFTGFVLLSIHNESSPAAASAVTAVSYPPTEQGMTAALYRAGLDPGSLAAAGVASNAVSGVVSDVRDYLTENQSALDTADANYAAARSDVASLERKVQSGLGTEADVTALASARSTLVTATAARDAAFTNLINAGTADLSNGQKTLLTAIRTNRDWELPIQYLTVNREEAQWVQLRNALAHKRIAEKRSETPDPDALAIIEAAQSNATVSTASSNYSANLTTVTTAWTQAVAQ